MFCNGPILVVGDAEATFPVGSMVPKMEAISVGNIDNKPVFVAVFVSGGSILAARVDAVEADPAIISVSEDHLS